MQQSLRQLSDATKRSTSCAETKKCQSEMGHRSLARHRYVQVSTTVRIPFASRPIQTAFGSAVKLGARSELDTSSRTTTHDDVRSDGQVFVFDHFEAALLKASYALSNSLIITAACREVRFSKAYITDTIHSIFDTTHLLITCCSPEVPTHPFDLTFLPSHPNAAVGTAKLHRSSSRGSCEAQGRRCLPTAVFHNSGCHQSPYCSALRHGSGLHCCASLHVRNVQTQRPS